MNEVDLRKSVVRIESIEGSIILGTGFIIHQDGILITCAHVIPAANYTTKKVNVVFSHFDEDVIIQANILEEGWSPPDQNDIAFLSVDKKDLPEDIVIAKLGNSEQSMFHPFVSFGFPKLTDSDNNVVFDGAWAIGNIEGDSTRKNKSRVIQINSQQLEKGYSGSPILDMKSNLVIGILTEVRITKPMAFATPSEIIVSNHTKLEIVKETLSIKKLRPFFAHVLFPAEHFKGRNTQLDLLNRFWNSGKPGIMSLIGIGGAGKTVIVRRFLDENKWLNADKNIERPDGLFVWSFYKKTDTAEFITAAYRYFSKFIDLPISNDNKKIEQANVYLLTDILENANGRFLIVLDGFEEMQSVGDEKSERGRLMDPSLRTLLSKIADGLCGQTKAIITSRASLTDFSMLTESKYREIDVNELEPEASVSLLREHHVLGPKKILYLTAKEFGFHALTIDLLGKLLSKFYVGDITRSSEIPYLPESFGSPSIERQAKELARVLYAYEKNLNNEELALLKCLSVFRRPINFSFVRDMIKGGHNITLLKNIAHLSASKLKGILHSLSSMRLLTKDKIGNEEWFTSHPAIRDYFYFTLSGTTELHDLVRNQLINLTNSSEFIKPKDSNAINLIEELIYHTLKIGKYKEAYQTYKDRLGYRHLGWNLGDHGRGAEIGRLFELDKEGNNFGDIELDQLIRLMIDNGLYLKNLGLLDDSMRFFEKSSKLDNDKNNIALSLQNLSAVQILRGYLPRAEDSGRSALQYALQSDDIRLVQDCNVRLATSLAFQGEVEEAIEIFTKVIAVLTKNIKEHIPRDLPGIRLGWLLMRIGRIEDAVLTLKDTLELSENLGFGIISSRANILLSEIAFTVGDINGSVEHLAKVKDWASSAYDQEMDVASNIMSARLALSSENGSLRAARFIRNGHRIASECGHSIYWIELKLLEGYMHLSKGNLDKAELCAHLALSGNSNGGVTLLGSSEKLCNYTWGEGDSYHLLGEIFIGRNEHQKAIAYLNSAKAIREKLLDVKIHRTNELLKKML